MFSICLRFIDATKVTRSCRALGDTPYYILNVISECSDHILLIRMRVRVFGNRTLHSALYVRRDIYFENKKCEMFRERERKREKFKYLFLFLSQLR